MPPAALISSTASFMPLLTGTPQPLIGPERSWCVPITISSAEMPWFVTLVCANAGAAASASAAPARPSFHPVVFMRFLPIANPVGVVGHLGPGRSGCLDLVGVLWQPPAS